MENKDLIERCKECTNYTEVKQAIKKKEKVARYKWC